MRAYLKRSKRCKDGGGGAIAVPILPQLAFTVKLPRLEICTI